MNGFKIDHKLISALSEQNPASGIKLRKPFSVPHELQSSGMSSEVDSPDEHDFTDAILKYISQMLMEEEDLERRPCMFQDCLALLATEKSLYDVIGEKYPPSLDNQNPLFVLDQNADSPNSSFDRTCSSHSSNSSTAVDNFVESKWFCDRDKFEPSFIESSSHVDYDFNPILESFGASNSFSDVLDGSVDSLFQPYDQVPDSYSESQLITQLNRGDPKFTHFLQYYKDHGNQQVEATGKNSKEEVGAEKNDRDHLPNGSRVKKNHYREDSDYVEGGRTNKQLASYVEDLDEPTEMYDRVLLCPDLNPHLQQQQQQESELCSDDDTSQQNRARSKLQRNGQSKGSNGGRSRGKKQSNTKEVVDLMTLLNQCAQAMATTDIRNANELLKRIRQHSSPYGDGTERLAHFFANALEARLAGAGTALYTAFAPAVISAADILKAYQVYIEACPFEKLSNFFANRSIGKSARKATRIHIIDFGILYGYQWPCLIQRLSIRPGGPPKIHITGIELPQPGFRPAERVEETGRRLTKYCERFGVPFEFTAIAKKWETIQLEDLKIDDRDEALVVNCLYRLKNVPDDTVMVSSPRDTVLNLIEKINPDLFVHGVLNGTFNAPFFVTRFKEALFHFSSLFDMYEATVPREDTNRMLFEKEVFGRDVMNVVACEGTQRVERPETYKQWQVRNMRAGFRQLPLDRELVEDVRTKVRKGYNKDFVVDEDSNWMLQGWKGRIIHAISCWKPVKKFE